MAKIKVTCINCGKEIERYPSQILNTIYCSKKCRSEYMKNNNTVLIKCYYCGEEKRIQKSHYKEKGRHFCSRKCKDEWQKEGLKGSNNPFYNKTHTQESKSKASRTKVKLGLRGKRAHNYNRKRVVCSECGKITYKIPYLIKRSKYHFCSTECHGRWKSKNLVGEKSPAWNPNLTNEEREARRKYPEYYDFIKSVMERDGYICDICGKYSKWGAGLNVHHLNGYNWDEKNRTNPDNGITLCRECHTSFHKEYGYGDNTELQYIVFKKSNELKKSV